MINLMNRMSRFFDQLIIFLKQNCRCCLGLANSGPAVLPTLVSFRVEAEPQHENWEAASRFACIRAAYRALANFICNES